MKFLPLVWSGLMRKPVRTLLTFLSIVVAFTLFGVLHGIDVGFAHIHEMQRSDRLFTVSRLGTPLHIADLQRIETVPGVLIAAPHNDIFGYWRDPVNGVSILSTDERWFAVFPETGITKDQIQQLLRVRTGAIVTAACAEQYGWKVADKISVVTNIAQKNGSKSWTFDILAIFSMEGHEAERYIVSNYIYVDEGRAEGNGTVWSFVMRTANVSQAEHVSQLIDRMFSTSGAPTRTFSERSAGQSEQNGGFNVRFFTETVVGGSFFTLLFLTINTMMASVRERVPEFAVLKTLGFTDLRVLVIVLMESAVVTVVGAVFGLAIAGFLVPLAKNTIGVAQVRSIVYLEGMICAIFVAGISGIVPGWHAKRLSIVDALAGR
jgi:putative ABC transport system permease protein